MLYDCHILYHVCIFFHEAGKNLSHGIRTSMNAIVGMTELMLSGLSMIFLTRIGEKNVELLLDIDPKLPQKLFGDT